MDDARALLDSLMGPSRDKDQKDKRNDEWKGRDVCKRFLVGFCPNQAQDNWFRNTRRDPGVCNKLHSERLKSDFDSHPDKQRYQAEYEWEFLKFLEGLVLDADAWIARERKNCSAPGKITKLTSGERQKIAEMQEKSEGLMKKAEDMADAGDLSGSKLAVETATKLRDDVAELKEKNTFMSQGEHVCEICGVRCNPDEQADYQAHMDGKLHYAYRKIRDKVKEMREQGRGTGPRPKDRDRDQEREKDKDMQKERNKDKDKEKEKEKGSARSRSRDRKKDKDRDRDRDRDRVRDRDRDRRR